MKFTNVFVTVGRADPRCLGSVDTSHPDADTIIASLKSQSMQGLIASGVDPARVSFALENEEREEKPAKKAGGKK